MKNKKTLYILGIETSCDETAAAVLEYKSLKKGNCFKIISNVVSSQIKIHRKYGGIIPEIAARAHLENILPVIKQALKPVNNFKSIDLIAVTYGPGLVTSLLVGVETAKTLSYTWQKPLININHLEGHLAANFVENSPQGGFPAVSLIVSGGHTELGLMRKPGQYQKIGQTRDDAAGECLDKIAKLLKLGYPGGPEIARQAEQFRLKPKEIKFKFPRPMINSNDFDFSFSGLKTAVLYFVKKNRNKLKNKKFIKSVCAESQQAVIDVLISKTIKASKKYKAKSVFLSGGVAANKELRKQLEFKVCSLPFKTNFLVPPRNLCTDNAAMIALAAALKFKNLTSGQKKKLKDNWQKIKVGPNLSI